MYLYYNHLFILSQNPFETVLRRGGFETGAVSVSYLSHNPFETGMLYNIEGLTPQSHSLSENLFPGRG